MRIRFDRAVAPLIKERKWHHSQQIRELRNGEVELRLELSSFVEIVPWILGWGNHARVLAPKSLVNAVKEVVKQLAGIYRRQDIAARPHLPDATDESTPSHAGIDEDRDRPHFEEGDHNGQELAGRVHEHDDPIRCGQATCV